MMNNESIFFITGMIVIPLTFLVLGLLVLRWLCGKGKCGKLLSAILAGVAAYIVITSIWPTQSFYVEEFEAKTGLPFPTSASFVHKCSTFPDGQGDYTSEAVFTLSSEDFAALQAYLEQAEESVIGSPRLPAHENMTEEQLLLWQTITENHDDQFSWGLMKDGQTAFFKFVRT